MPAKILIIEDNSGQSKPLIQMLTYRGFEIIHAANGIDGCAKAIAALPDLVIIDLLLVERGDEMDGYEVINVLRNTKQTAKVAILAWTGHFVERKDEIRVLRAGADDYLSKDAEIGVLEARIEALLRRIGRG